MPWYDKLLVYVQFYFSTMVHFVQYDLEKVTVSWLVRLIGFNPLTYLGLVFLAYFLGVQDVLMDPGRSWKQKILTLVILFVSVFIFLFFLVVWRIAFPG